MHNSNHDPDPNTTDIKGNNLVEMNCQLSSLEFHNGVEVY
jgi:hypothetical protein